MPFVSDNARVATCHQTVRLNQMSTIGSEKTSPLCETVVQVCQIRFFLYCAVFAVVMQFVSSTTEADEPLQEPIQKDSLKLTLERWASIQKTAQQKGPIQPGTLGPSAAKLLPRLRELLPEADIGSKLVLSRAIWQISGKAEEPANALAEIISAANRWRCEDAVYQFYEMGSASFCVFPAILALSKDPRDAVRACAVNVLGAFGPEHKRETEEHLLVAINDKSPQVRLAASEALVKVGGSVKNAIETLVDIISQPMEIVHAVWKATPEERLLVSAIEAIGKLEEEAVDAVRPLCSHLNSPNINVRQAAASALGKIGPGAEPAIPQLRIAMRDTESSAVPMVHIVISAGDEAAKALGSIGPAAVPELIAALKDISKVARVRAIRVLGGNRGAARKTAIPIAAKLSDKSATVRLEAIKALGKLGKEGNLAAPALTKFLFTSCGLTSFPSGSGIGLTEQFSSEALLALRSIEATETQVVPVLLDSLGWKENPTLESIAVIRQYPNRITELVSPLRRLLADENLGAACALATLGVSDRKIQTILADNLIDDQGVNSVAALGIGQLIAHGIKLDEVVSAQLSAAKEYYSISILTILFRLKPDDESTLSALMSAMRDFNPMFTSEIDLEEAEAALVDLIHHPRVKDALLKDLDNRPVLIRSHYLSPRILIAANQNQEEAFKCLERELALKDNISEFAGIVDLLGKRPLSEPAKALLVQLLGCEERRIVGGDFHSGGGELRMVGDRAARALVRQHAVSALVEQLTNTGAQVRVRVVRALGACGAVAVAPKLIGLAKDSDPRVRLEVIKTIGRFGTEHFEKRIELRPVLESATGDRLRTVRDQASRELLRW